MIAFDCLSSNVVLFSFQEFDIEPRRSTIKLPVRVKVIPTPPRRFVNSKKALQTKSMQFLFQNVERKHRIQMSCIYLVTHIICFFVRCFATCSLRQELHSINLTGALLRLTKVTFRLIGEHFSVVQFLSLAAFVLRAVYILYTTPHRVCNT